MSLLFLSLAVPPSVSADLLEGRVVRIADGDTLTVLAADVKGQLYCPRPGPPLLSTSGLGGLGLRVRVVGRGLGS